jgi:hypothetical protein
MATFHGLWSLAGFTGAAIGTLMVSKNIFRSGILRDLFAADRFVLYSASVLHCQRCCSSRSTGVCQTGWDALLMLGLIAFSCMACEGTMFDWSGVYFQKVVEAPKELTTLGYVAFMGTMAGGRFIGDRIVTRFGKQKVLQGSGIVIATGLLNRCYLSACGYSNDWFFIGRHRCFIGCSAGI